MAFLSKIRTLFSISKRAGEASPPTPPSYAPVSVQCGSINILGNACINCSDYGNALNMHDHLHVQQAFQDALGSEYGTVVYARVMQSSKYALLLHMPQ